MSDVLEATLARLREDAGVEAASGFVRLVADYFENAGSGVGPVSRAVRAPATEDGPGDGPSSLDDTLRALGARIDDANRLWHPMYMGHQVAPPLPAAIWTEMVVGALNQSLAVREMSPSATPIELELIRWMSALVWPGSPGAGGTFTSGGTEAIFTSLLAARNAALPDVARDGVRGPAAIVCGEHAHYAAKRAAAEIGLGSRGAVQVASAGGRMDVADLERTLDRLERDGVPVVAVVATAGITATGAFDPLRAIGELCAARGLWLHVDAAHGGSALLSARHRTRLDGIEHASSVSWDPHKMMLVPLSAGVVLVRDRRALERAVGQDAPYLFRSGGAGAPEPDDADAGEQGMRSFMCSRRADALKVWVALRRYGVEGIAALFDGLCDRTRELHDLLAARADFEVLHQPECNILCFRYVGAGDLPAERLDDLNLWLRESWNASGDGWITTTVFEGRRVLRVVVMNPLTDGVHLARLADGLADLAARAPFATPQPLR